MGRRGRFLFHLVAGRRTLCRGPRAGGRLPQESADRHGQRGGRQERLPVAGRAPHLPEAPAAAARRRHLPHRVRRRSPQGPDLHLRALASAQRGRPRGPDRLRPGRLPQARLPLLLARLRRRPGLPGRAEVPGAGRHHREAGLRGRGEAGAGGGRRLPRQLQEELQRHERLRDGLLGPDDARHLPRQRRGRRLLLPVPGRGGRVAAGVPGGREGHLPPAQRHRLRPALHDLDAPAELQPEGRLEDHRGDGRLRRGAIRQGPLPPRRPRRPRHPGRLGRPQGRRRLAAHAAKHAG